MSSSLLSISLRTVVKGESVPPKCLITCKTVAVLQAACFPTKGLLLSGNRGIGNRAQGIKMRHWKTDLDFVQE